MTGFASLAWSYNGASSFLVGDVWIKVTETTMEPGPWNVPQCFRLTFLISIFVSLWSKDSVMAELQDEKLDAQGYFLEKSCS